MVLLDIKLKDGREIVSAHRSYDEALTFIESTKRLFGERFDYYWVAFRHPLPMTTDATRKLYETRMFRGR